VTREAGAASFVYKHRLVLDVRPAVLGALKPVRFQTAGAFWRSLR
jgi:hypothetical protein